MADKYPEIFVLRHGQTEWNQIARFQGRKDSALTGKGREQAKAQGELLTKAIAARDGVMAYCSPQGRAAKTAAIALGPLGLAAKEDTRLCEISFGEWEGLTFDQIGAGWPEHTKDADMNGFEWQFHAPGGESFEAMRQRIEDFLAHLSAPSIIVTHGITSRILRGVWLGQGNSDLGAVMGGQGCVYHMRDGQQTKLGD